MIVYIVVVAVFVAILWASYRSLGAPSLAERAPDRAIDAVRGVLHEGIASMQSANGSRAEVAKSARRSAAAATQELDRLDPSDNKERREAQETLNTVAHDITWAAKMMEAPDYDREPGMQAAASVLLDHAIQALDER